MILLSAGHHPAAVGACYNDFCEHDEAVHWVNTLQHLLRGRTHVDVVPTGTLTEKVKFINGYQHEKVALAVEVHFNSDPQHAGRGCETLYCPGSVKGLKAAALVQDAISSLLGPNRGVKEGWYRMDKPGHVDYPGDVEGDEKPDYFLKATNPVALIVEPEFIHNRLAIESLRQMACEVMADALIEAVNVIQQKEV